MTSKTVREGPNHPMPGMLKEIIISCDQMNCDKAINDQTIREQGGLKEMGWTVLPTEGEVRHYCPEHKR